MKRLLALTLADIRFQFRYGFYTLYLFVSVLYTVVILFLPPAWRETARLLCVFSDPAALGLFFMGAIMLFEKGEKVLSSIAVSPVHTSEYVLAKVFSIGFVSLLSGILIMVESGGSIHLYFAIGVFLASSLFTLLGITFAARINTINQFLIVTVPCEIIVFTPVIFYIFGFSPTYLLFHPGVLVIQLLRPNSPINPLLATALLFVWIAIVFVIAKALSSPLFRENISEASV